VSLTCPAFKLDEVPRQTLLNIGLLRLEAYCQESVIQTLNMVVHISRDKEDGLLKTILNPID